MWKQNNLTEMVVTGSEVREMEEKNIKDMTAKEILRRQLELLAEEAEKSAGDPQSLVLVTDAILRTVSFIDHEEERV